MHDNATHSKASPRDKREAAGLTQIQVAVAAGTSTALVAKYEANPDAVTHREKRAALDKAYAGMNPKGGRDGK